LGSINNGVFLTIDGIDGSGKTTQSKILVDSLIRNNFDAIYTMEPSNGQIGTFIKKKLIVNEKASPEVEALLFAADRFEHINTEILPLLKKGKIVVSDRYVYASIAYQGAQGIDLEWIENLNYFTIEPDLAIYIDVPPEVGISRKKGKKSVFENLDSLNIVRKIYQDLVNEGRLTLINGMKNKDEISNELYKLVLQTIIEKISP
jgi:dTMP kinase